MEHKATHVTSDDWSCVTIGSVERPDLSNGRGDLHLQDLSAVFDGRTRRIPHDARAVAGFSRGKLAATDHPRGEEQLSPCFSANRLPINTVLAHRESSPRHATRTGTCDKEVHYTLASSAPHMPDRMADELRRA